MAEDNRSNILKSIRELKNQDPYHAFDILTASGDRYRIANGANLVVMKSEFFYAYPGGDKFVLIRINQITAVERPETRPPMPRRRR
jgi:hypothetical protein